MNLSSDLTRPRDLQFTWRYGQELLMVRYHPVQFGGHKHCSSGDVFNLSMWLSMQETLVVSHHFARFGVHWHCGNNEMIIVCHLISQDRDIKGPCGLMTRSRSTYVIILPRLVAIGNVIVKIKCFQFIMWFR